MGRTDLALLPRRGKTVEEHLEVLVQLGHMGSLTFRLQRDMMLDCTNFSKQSKGIERLLNDPKPLLDDVRYLW
ncbi:MAG TPA: hypothetical protein VMO47_03650 [Rhodothermales bacterium]|nr:hypothetical protein [Rhodothermales bacterium]